MRCVLCSTDFNPEEIVKLPQFDADGKPNALKWFCPDGKTPHKVEPQTFFMSNAPAPSGLQSFGNDGNRAGLEKHGRLVVTGIPPNCTRQLVGEDLQPNDDLTEIVGSIVVVDGVFRTDDPEKIYWLERKPQGYFCSESEWMAAWLSPEKQREYIQARRTEIKKQLEALQEV